MDFLSRFQKETQTRTLTLIDTVRGIEEKQGLDGEVKEREGGVGVGTTEKQRSRERECGGRNEKNII